MLALPDGPLGAAEVERTAEAVLERKPRPGILVVAFAIMTARGIFWLIPIHWIIAMEEDMTAVIIPFPNKRMYQHRPLFSKAQAMMRIAARRKDEAAEPHAICVDIREVFEELGWTASPHKPPDPAA